MDGKSHDFIFAPTLTSSEITQHVFDNWPECWNGEVTKPDRSEILRLIYRGRFLHTSTTLECKREGERGGKGRGRGGGKGGECN